MRYSGEFTEKQLVGMRIAAHIIPTLSGRYWSQRSDKERVDEAIKMSACLMENSDIFNQVKIGEDRGISNEKA